MEPMLSRQVFPSPRSTGPCRVDRVLPTTGIEDFGNQTRAQVKDKIIRGTVVRDAANVPAFENQTIHGFIGTNTDHIL